MIKRSAIGMRSFILATLCCAAIPAQAGDAYVGVSVGREDWINHDINAKRMGLSSSAVTTTMGDVPRKFFAGYQFNDYFAIEGGYFNVGGILGKETVATSGLPQNIILETAGWDITGVGTLPLGAGFSLFGKFGIYTANTEATYIPPVGGEMGHIFSSTDVMAGAGANWEFKLRGQQFGVRGEWERFQKVANNATYFGAGPTLKDGDGYNIDLVTLGLFWKF